MSLDLDKLSALFDLLAAKDVAEFEHEEDGVRLRVARGAAIARGRRAAAPPSAGRRGAPRRGGARRRRAARATTST